MNGCAKTDMTFSAKDSCAQAGMLVMSIEEPHAAAALLFAVIMFVYACIAVIEELCKTDERSPKDIA